jgi:hypothetical protein
MLQRLKLFIIVTCILLILFCHTFGNEHFEPSKKMIKAAKAQKIANIAYIKKLSANGKQLVILHYRNYYYDKNWIIQTINMQRYVRNKNQTLIVIFTSRRCHKVKVLADCQNKDIECADQECHISRNQKGLDHFKKKFNHWIKKGNDDTVEIQMYTNKTTDSLVMGFSDIPFRKVKNYGKHHEILVISNASVKTDFHVGHCKKPNNKWKKKRKKPKKIKPKKRIVTFH